jgi:hypothetical protein
VSNWIKTILRTRLARRGEERRGEERRGEERRGEERRGEDFMMNSILEVKYAKLIELTIF